MVKLSENWKAQVAGKRGVWQCDIAYFCLALCPFIAFWWLWHVLSKRNVLLMSLFGLFVLFLLVFSLLSGAVLALMNRWNKPLFLLAIYGLVVSIGLLAGNTLNMFLRLPWSIEVILVYGFTVLLLPYPFVALILAIRWFAFARWRRPDALNAVTPPE